MNLSTGCPSGDGGAMVANRGDEISRICVATEQASLLLSDLDFPEIHARDCHEEIAEIVRTRRQVALIYLLSLRRDLVSP